VVDRHLPKLLLGEDPFQLERLWDIMWRGTLYYGRKGAVVHAISAVDNALWDIVGKALHKPVYQLLGEVDRQRVPGYCTGNNIEQAVEFGFKKLKLALPYGPVDGEKGLDQNEQLVQRARRILGPDGEIMLDCWMALTESYTEQLAARLKPYRVYWMEECLMPDDYVGMRRLNAKVGSTRMATGEHEYTRYGFELLARHKAADIWQPDMNWCGGLTEMRWIDSLARSLAPTRHRSFLTAAGGVAQPISFSATKTLPGARCFFRGPAARRRFTTVSRKTMGLRAAPRESTCDRLTGLVLDLNSSLRDGVDSVQRNSPRVLERAPPRSISGTSYLALYVCRDDAPVDATNVA
jgi:L-alanine-DL-glutamate epimerase-like enolase superfamily enzyme